MHARARCTLESLKDSVSSLGEAAGDRARRLGGKTSTLARRIGPKRGIVALAVIGASVGAAFVVRYVKSRAQR